LKTARLFVSETAATDIVEQADWYESQSGKLLAARWESAVTASVLRIVKTPEAGTPCIFRSSELRDVRRTTITGFPKHLIFYRFHEGQVLILRVIHGARDLERLF
jgi:toxin ParE1/3/4